MWHLQRCHGKNDDDDDGDDEDDDDDDDDDRAGGEMGGGGGDADGAEALNLGAESASFVRSVAAQLGQGQFEQLCAQLSSADERRAVAGVLS